VGWTTGEQQARRYNLRDEVDRLVWEFNEDGGHYLTAYKEGQQRFHQQVDEDQLPAYVGREVAEQLLAQPATKTFSGTRQLFDLPENQIIGGKGMIRQYDEMMVRQANKFLAPFGAKVEQLPVKVNKQRVPRLLEDRIAAGEAIKRGQPPAYGPRRSEWREVRNRTAGGVWNGPPNAWTEGMETHLQQLLAQRAALQETTRPSWVVRLTPEIRAKIRAAGLPLMALPLAVAHQREERRE
jgi:hypothetical protein